MNYGDVALGVECALPRNIDLVRRSNYTRQFMHWFFTAFVRRN